MPSFLASYGSWHDVGLFLVYRHTRMCRRGGSKLAYSSDHDRRLWVDWSNPRPPDPPVSVLARVTGVWILNVESKGIRRKSMMRWISRQAVGRQRASSMGTIRVIHTGPRWDSDVASGRNNRGQRQTASSPNTRYRANKNQPLYTTVIASRRHFDDTSYTQNEAYIYTEFSPSLRSGPLLRPLA